MNITIRVINKMYWHSGENGILRDSYDWAVYLYKFTIKIVTICWKMSDGVMTLTIVSYFHYD